MPALHMLSRPAILAHIAALQDSGGLGLRIYTHFCLSQVLLQISKNVSCQPPDKMVSGSEPAYHIRSGVHGGMQTLAPCETQNNERPKLHVQMGSNKQHLASAFCDAAGVKELPPGGKSRGKEQHVCNAQSTSAKMRVEQVQGSAYIHKKPVIILGCST